MALELSSKVIVVGLDGATMDLIGPMVAEGKLPNISKIMKSGVASKLYSTILPLSPTAWTSFASGKNAGKHGIYDFSKRVEGRYDYKPTTSMDSKTPALWDLIGAMGGKSIVINVPLTYPVRKINGFMISGFPTPTQRGDYTYPADLLPALKERFGEVNIHKPKVLYQKGKEEQITNETLRITKQQTEINRYLMDSTEWNFLVSVYDATDVIGHYFWAYLDENHPKYDPKLAKTVKQMVEDIHVELDRSVGNLMEGAGPEALKFVISDHGFGSVYYGVYVNNWLLEQNYMHFKNTVPVKARYWAFRHGLHTYNLLQLAKKLHLVQSIESAYAEKSLKMQLLKMASLSMDDIDWTRTKVYSAGNFGQLYLNLKGREPNGIVPPEEADELIEELVEKLQKLDDPQSKRRLFDRIYARWDVFTGVASEEAPDIVFFDDEMIYAAHRMFELGSNKLVSLHPVYSGNHKMDGIMFMAGRGVKYVMGPPSVKPNLIDLAPTILHFMGAPIPSDMDGRILSELFESDSDFSRRQIEFASATNEATKIKGSLQKLTSSRHL